MLDQLLGAVLFLFGIQSGNVRGDSTPSAIASSSASATSSAMKNEERFRAIPKNDLKALEMKFLEKKKNALRVWESKHASFSASLKTIKNEKKKVLLEELQNRIMGINAHQTSLFMTVLKRLNYGVEEMQKIAEAYALETGKDLSSVTTSLTNASKAISDAITAVTAQADKTYMVSITSETKLKDDFGKARSLLASDLKKVRDLVHDARKKVGEALKALKSAIGKPVKITVQSDTEAAAVPLNTVTPTP